MLRTFRADAVGLLSHDWSQEVYSLHFYRVGRLGAQGYGHPPHSFEESLMSGRNLLLRIRIWRVRRLGPVDKWCPTKIGGFFEKEYSSGGVSG